MPVDLTDMDFNARKPLLNILKSGFDKGLHAYFHALVPVNMIVTIELKQHLHSSACDCDPRSVSAEPANAFGGHAG
jgi:hypothetical protein